MLEAMPWVDVQHFVQNGCRKRSYAPTLALTRVKWDQKVSLGAQTTLFEINLRIMWTELKMDGSFSMKCLKIRYKISDILYVLYI